MGAVLLFTDSLHVDPHLVVHALYDFGEGSEHGGALLRTLDDVVDGVGERRLLEAAVDVPSGPADLGTTAKMLIKC